MSTSTHRVIVAEEDGEIVGVLHAFERPALEKPCEVVVQALIVDETRRGSGIGAVLMHEAETWATTCGLSSTALYTRIDRDLAPHGSPVTRLAGPQFTSSFSPSLSMTLFHWAIWALTNELNWSGVP